MRFISKNSNLRVILKPGLPAEPLTGRPSDPGISVKFQDGLLEVSDQVIIDKMLAHAGLTMDFWAVQDGELKDPFKHMREEIEPVHSILQFKYGRPDEVLTSAKKPKLSPEIEKMLNERAFEIAKDLLPGMIEQLMKVGAEKQKADKVVSEEAKMPSADSESSSQQEEAQVSEEAGKKKHWKTIEKEKKEALLKKEAAGT
jgi:hypothetical protein